MEIAWRSRGAGYRPGVPETIFMIQGAVATLTRSLHTCGQIPWRPARRPADLAFEVKQRTDHESSEQSTAVSGMSAQALHHQSHQSTPLTAYLP
jgi:hypothetical protein